MQITLTLSEKEIKFLRRMIEEDTRIGNGTKTIDDVVHECIARAMYDESEVSAQEEGM